MFAPLTDFLEWSYQSHLLIGFFIGIGFGFFLEQAGFGNANILAKTFYFRDMTVVKVMFTSIITAMSGLIIFDHFSWINMDLLWINPSYIWPGVVGGLIMGAGFVVGGYCPGTSLVGAATLKIDAMVNILGGLVGMAFAAEVIPYVYDFWTSSLIGKRITIQEYFDVRVGVVGAIVIVIALVMFIASEKVEKIFGEEN